MVVDGHMHVLPAGAEAALDDVAGDAVAHVPEAAQLLGVQVQQLPGLGALTAHNRGPRDSGAAGVPLPPRHLAHGRDRAAPPRAQRHRSRAAALARREDLGLGTWAAATAWQRVSNE